MKITWSLPTNGARLDGSRGDLVRASRLIEALRHDGHEVEVVESGARPAAEAAVAAYRGVVRRLLPRRPALTLRDAGRWLRARAHARRVAAVARRQRADAIVETQVHFVGSGGWAAQQTGLPLVLDDCSPLSEAIVLGAGLPGLAGHVFRRQVHEARCLTVSSEALRARLTQDGVPYAKLQVVPNGVDLGAYQRADGEAVRRRLGLSHGCVLVFAGSFQPWHRAERLIEALAALGEGPPVDLLLIGDGPERARVLSAAERLGVLAHVFAVGAVPPADVPELIAAGDIGVLPASNDYGQPMKLVEYAAAGLPSVAPDLAPVREVVRDGATGLLFDPDDAASLARALSLLVGDETRRRAMGERARAHVADASWQHRARSLLAHVSGLA